MGYGLLDFGVQSYDNFCKYANFSVSLQNIWGENKKYGNYTHVDTVTKNNKNYLLKKQLKQLSRQSNSTPFAHEAHRGPRISWCAQ